MDIERRALIGGLIACAAAGRARSAAIVRGEITPEMFGATGKDPEADTRAWTLAVAQAAREGRPVVGRGTYVLRVGTAYEPSWSHGPSPIRLAVPLPGNVQVQGRDLVFRVAPTPPSQSALERHFLFGTTLNPEPGTLKNIGFEDVRFDFDSAEKLDALTYAIGVTGVDGFTRRRVTVESSGQMAGRGLFSQNVRNRSDSGLVHRNIIQGIYTRNERGVRMTDIAFDGFVEALDFDGPCWDVQLSDLRFNNGVREGQCIDTAGGSDWSVDNVQATDVGNVISIYNKANSWPTYRESLEHGTEPTTASVIGERVRVTNIRATNAGRLGQKAILVGNRRYDRWPLPGHPSPRDISFSDIRFTNCSQILVNEGEDLNFTRMQLRNSRTPDDPETGAALAFRAQAEAGSRADHGSLISGTVSDVTITNSQGMGVSAIAGPELAFSSIRIDGFDTADRPNTGAGMRLRPAKGGHATAKRDAVTISGGPAGSLPLDDALTPLPPSPPRPSAKDVSR